MLTFFGKYIGTVRESGFWFANPLASKQKISLKVNNFQSPQLKVNDAHGNPIEIGAVIVWRVVDTAQALFDVEDYRSFVHIQCETALRRLASHYPYEPHVPDEIALRSHPADVAAKLREEVQERTSIAGIEIMEPHGHTRLRTTHPARPRHRPGEELTSGGAKLRQSRSIVHKVPGRKMAPDERFTYISCNLILQIRQELV